MRLPDFLSFTPVPLKLRQDGWTPELQLRFIVALARGASIDLAARSVGKSRTTAYGLRNRPGAESFVAAWVAALNYAKHRRAGLAGAPLPPESTSAAEAEALLDRLYPAFRRKSRQNGAR